MPGRAARSLAFVRETTGLDVSTQRSFREARRRPEERLKVRRNKMPTKMQTSVLKRAIIPAETPITNAFVGSAELARGSSVFEQSINLFHDVYLFPQSSKPPVLVLLQV